MTTKVPVELSSTPGIADSSNATAITIDSSENTTFSGDVEIGTTAPKINLKNTDTSIVADQSLGVIEVESSDGSTGSAGTIAKLDIAASGAFDGSGHGSDFRFTTGATNQSGSIALSEVMRITSTGRVGIGKTDPNYPLVVAGTNPKIQIYDSAGSGQTNLYFGDSGSNLAGYVIYQHSDNKMRLGTNATDRMIIQSDGGVMFNTSTALGQTTSFAGTNTNNWCGKTTTDTYSNFLGFASGGNITYYVTGQGNYFYNGSAVSDRDLKENIESITESSLAKVKLLEPKTFNFKADDNFGTNKKTGFIAQEVAAIFGTTDGVATGTDGQKDMGIDPTGLIAHLTKAIQEQQTQIEALQSEINTLKGE